MVETWVGVDRVVAGRKCHEFLLLLMVISDNILSICSLQVYLEQVESIIEYL